MLSSLPATDAGNEGSRTAALRITRQLRGIAETIRALHALNPDDYDGREALWIEHFNLLKQLEALT